MSDVVLSDREIPEGIHHWGPVRVPEGATGCEVRLYRLSRWRELVTEGKRVGIVSLQVDFTANGVHWNHVGGFGATGASKSAPFSGTTLPLPGGESRALRGSILCGRSIQARLEVEWR